MAKDKYSSDQDPKHCGHPNQIPVIKEDKNSPSGKTTGAKCGSYNLPGCGKTWPSK